MKRSIYTVFLLLSVCQFTHAQTEMGWVVGTGGIYMDDGNVVKTDMLGNVYVGGMFKGTVDFDPGPEEFNLTASGDTSDSDGFVQKLDKHGNFVWAVRFGTAGDYNEVNSIQIDEFNQVYVVGIFWGVTDFDPGPGVFNLNSNGGSDAFVMKLDESGGLIWSKAWGGVSSDQPNDLSIDPSGDICIVGSYKDMVDFDPGPNVFNLTSNGDLDAFALKMDSDGNFIWAKSIGGLGYDMATSLCSDAYGNIFATGYFGKVADFDPGPDVLNLTSNGHYDFFVLKLDLNGDLIWVNGFGSHAPEYGDAISITDQGNLYITGYFSGMVDFDPGPLTANIEAVGLSRSFVQKLDSNGNLIWAKSTGGTGTKGIVSDSEENIYITGKYQNTMDFDPGSGTHNLTSLGGADIFVQKLNSNGDLIWVESMGGLDNDYSSSIALDFNNDVLVTGCFYEAGSFGIAPNSNDILSNGIADIFTVKFIQANVYGSVFQDFDSNCQKAGNEVAIAGITLLVEPGNITTHTNVNGFWEVVLPDTGVYTITVDTTSENWESTCPTTQSFTIVDLEDIVIGPNFGFVSNAPCPEPDISIQAPFLRPGFSNQGVYVQACNLSSGTELLESAYVVVELDTLLTVQSVTLPYTSIGNNQYSINIGDLYPGECVDFVLFCELSANAILGQSVCMEAALFPVDTCSLDTIPLPIPLGMNPCSTAYDLSHLSISTSCDGDSIQFIIENEGSGDMTCYSQVRVFLDGQYFLMDSIQLAAGEITGFSFFGEGKTWRLEVDQHFLHPGNSKPSATRELCGNSTNWTPNLVNALPHDDADPVVDIFCGIVAGSYDPNDKTASPFGVGSAYHVLPNQDIEYVIRFQNTGTDTAFTVVIRDVLSPTLDLSSVISGASSNDYEFKIYSPNILEWRFNNIMLPDSNTNEVGSHGFISFKVSQVPNLSVSTVVSNQAAIYFDFNEPILTNTSWNTIHLPSLLIEEDEAGQNVGNSQNLEIEIYPNPTSGIAHIFNHKEEELTISVYDNLGRVLFKTRSDEKISSLDLSKFDSGIYHLFISNENDSSSYKIVKTR